MVPGSGYCRTLIIPQKSHMLHLDWSCIWENKWTPWEMVAQCKGHLRSTLMNGTNTDCRSVHFQGTWVPALAFPAPAALAYPGAVRNWSLSCHPDSANQSVMNHQRPTISSWFTCKRNMQRWLVWKPDVSAQSSSLQHTHASLHYHLCSPMVVINPSSGLKTENQEN